MSKDRTRLQRIEKVIVEQLDVTPEKVTPEASFLDDLGADSLDRVELVMAIEEEFDIEIPQSVSEKWTTVGEVQRYIAAL